MKKILTITQEYVMPTLIVLSFLAYYFDVFKDGMMISGIFAVVIMVYMGIIWQEHAHDEREEYIRSKVDRYLYIITLLLLFINILHKTFTHESYMDSVIILTLLSLAKIVLSKTISNQS